MPRRLSLVAFERICTLLSLSLSCVRACVRAFASRRECHRLYTHMKIHEGIDACTHTRADLGRKERGARAGAGEHEYEFAHEAAANCI